MIGRQPDGDREMEVVAAPYGEIFLDGTLPKDLTPTSWARPWSLIAPAVISDALAEFSLRSTTSGLLKARPVPVTFFTSSRPPRDTRIVLVPWLTNSLITSFAAPPHPPRV